MALSIYTKTCAKNIAGNNAVLVTEASNVSSVVVDASGEVTAINMNASATFKQLQADQDSILRVEEAYGSDSNLSYAHSIEMGFAKGSVNLNTLRDSLAAASACGIIAIVQDSNGKSWLIGYNEVDGTKRALRLTQDNYGSGNSPADEDVQKADVILASISGYVDLPLDSALNTSISDALAAGGGTAIEWGSTLSAYSYNGTSQYSFVADNGDLDIVEGTTDFSYCGWMKTGSDITTSQYCFGKLVAGQLNGRYGVYISAGAISTLTQNQAGLFSIDDNIVLAINTWYHVAVRIDLSGLLMYLYIDGVLQNPGGEACAGVFLTTANEYEYYIACGNDGAGSTQASLANIQARDVRVYHKDISSDLTAIMNGASIAGEVAWWKLGTFGETDEVGNHNLTSVGSPSVVQI